MIINTAYYRQIADNTADNAVILIEAHNMLGQIFTAFGRSIEAVTEEEKAQEVKKNYIGYFRDVDTEICRDEVTLL